MNLPLIKFYVYRAVNKFYARDAILIINDASEWSISHRVAVYLENEFIGWNVDCEYNRQGQIVNPKVNTDSEIIRPDIILHHRRYTDISHNLLVVEIKKDDTNADFNKICDYTKLPEGNREFQYQFGLSLIINNKPSYYWFIDGNKV